MNETPSSSSSSPANRTLLYGLTIFLGAFLLFQVEPLIAKIILPWFGGVAAVWAVCLLFFQTVLLLGYLYAHLLTTKLGARTQGWVHAAALAVSLAALPILPRDSWKPAGPGDPALRILLVLSATVGLPFFLLSATSPLLQAWHARARPDGKPYRFYALSNAGSLLALLTYPVAFEPFFTSRHQALGWSAAYGSFAVLCAWIAVQSRASAIAAPPRETAPRPGWRVQTLWVALAACASAMLLAVTNHISQNIAAVPFLWVLPLSLYLLSFILCFEGRSWYRRPWFLRLLGVALGGMAYALSPAYANAPVKLLIPLFCGGFFICCMVCHGELAALKPHASHLTAFYLLAALGGALGAVFVALIAPRVFSGYYELHIAMGMCAILVIIVLYREHESVFPFPQWRLACLAIAALAATLIASLSVTAYQQAAGARLRVRNFYGVLTITDHVAPNIVMLKGSSDVPLDADTRYRKLMNGTIDHGLQFLGSARRREPTTYYGPYSGIGVALRAAGLRGPVRVGVIGLGAGTLAAYGRAGDRYTFYEINPLVVEIAREEFSFLQDSPASTDVVLGDARLSLEREPPQGFDVLAVDAFSGDSIPVHLLTREAFALYFRHLKPGGVLAVHISNKFLDLQPVVEGAAAALGKNALLIINEADDKAEIYRAAWILISGQTGLFGQPAIGQMLMDRSRQQLWTDDYSSMFRILR